jgi:hypothetical protein
MSCQPGKVIHIKRRIREERGENRMKNLAIKTLVTIFSLAAALLVLSPGSQAATIDAPTP